MDIWTYMDNFAIRNSNDYSKIEVNVTGYCSFLCVNFSVIDNGGNTIFTVSEASTSGLETLVFNNQGFIPLGTITLDGFEAKFYSIIIFVENNICETKSDIETEKGDFYVDDSCYGEF